MPHGYAVRDARAWLPDIRDPKNPGFVEIANAVPTVNGLGGVPDYQDDFTNAIGISGEVVTGTFWGRDPYGDALSIVATRYTDDDGNPRTKFRGLQGRIWVDMSPEKDPVHGEGPWHFVQVSSTVIAINESKPYRLDLEDFYAPVIVETSYSNRTFTFGNRAIESNQQIVVRLSDYILIGGVVGYDASTNIHGIISAAVSSDGLLTLGAASVGSTTTRVRASDAQGRSSEVVFTIVVPNQRPVASFVPDQSVAVGSSVEVDLGDYFTDTAGDTITYTAVSGTTSLATVVVRDSRLEITGVAAGTLSVGVVARDQDGLAASTSVGVRVT